VVSRRFDPEKDQGPVQLLGPLERMVFEQVRCPNEAAHFHAKLEGVRGTLPGSAGAEKMTLYCLAEGLRMDAGEFIGLLKSVVDRLGAGSRTNESS
jgi:hypothetical protein